MADSPCMKNRSLKAGGRLNRWSLKAGFTVTALTVELKNIAKILPDATPLKFTKWAVSLVLKRFSKFCSVISVKNNRLCSPSQRKLQKSDLTKRNSIFGEIESAPIKAGFHKVKPRLSSNFKYLERIVVSADSLKI